MYIKQFLPVECGKPYKYHGLSEFVEDLCAINAKNEFLELFKKSHPK